MLEEASEMKESEGGRCERKRERDRRKKGARRSIGDMTTSPATSVLVNGNTAHLRLGTSLRMRIRVAAVLAGFRRRRHDRFCDDSRTSRALCAPTRFQFTRAFTMRQRVVASRNMMIGRVQKRRNLVPIFT